MKVVRRVSALRNDASYLEQATFDHRTVNLIDTGENIRVSIGQSLVTLGI